MNKYPKFMLLVNAYVLDDYFDVMCATLKYESYMKEFYHSVIYPHRVVYHIGPVSETGVKNWKNKFNTIYNGADEEYLPTFKAIEVDIDDYR